MSRHEGPGCYRSLRVTSSEDGYLVTVELHRPGVLNAMNTAMGEDLLACFEGLERNKTVRAVLLTGAGERAFSVGADLKEREGMTDEAWRAQHVIFEQAAFKLLRCPVPVIVAVEGYALGGGCELTLLSDFVVASDAAVFGLPEVARGIFPGIGGPLLLPRITGAPFAKEMIFTGRRVPAQEAKAVGLVNHLVSAGQARAKAQEIGEVICQNGPVAVRQVKKVITWGAETDLETGMILAIEAYNNTINTEDRLEGVRAFNERRLPKFQGR
ncbi:MAG: enoyl-CoA hydratase/isomerase family protein [Candidatus Methylomirabilia bacterium]